MFVKIHLLHHDLHMLLRSYVRRTTSVMVLMKGVYTYTVRWCPLCYKCIPQDAASIIILMLVVHARVSKI